MKNIKGFIAGVITTLLVITLITTVFALQEVKTIDVTYRDIKITIDGELIEPKDALGNIVEPFLYGGTNYLPVRAVAELAGYDVDWDGNTNTIILTSKPFIYNIILNISTKVYHMSKTCLATAQIIDANRKEMEIYDVSEIPEDYAPCGICAK